MKEVSFKVIDEMTHFDMPSVYLNKIEQKGQITQKAKKVKKFGF